MEENLFQQRTDLGQLQEAVASLKREILDEVPNWFN